MSWRSGGGTGNRCQQAKNSSKFNHFITLLCILGTILGTKQVVNCGCSKVKRNLNSESHPISISEISNFKKRIKCQFVVVFLIDGERRSNGPRFRRRPLGTTQAFGRLGIIRLGINDDEAVTQTPNSHRLRLPMWGTTSEGAFVSQKQP